MRRLPIRLLLVFLIACASSPAWAFVVILKDGKQIPTDGNYVRQGDMVILKLPNGTTASYPAADIDFAKTDEVNKGRNLSNTRLLEGGQAKQLDKETTFEESKKSFAELISERSGSLALPERSRREDEDVESETQALPRTRAGFVDLKELRREPYPNEEEAAEIARYLRGQGSQDVRVYRGTAEGRPLVEIVAVSEASVFKALRDSANCLVQARGQFPSLQSFDLLLMTENQVLAGQFTLTPELAGELVTGKIEPPAFFLRYVEF